MRRYITKPSRTTRRKVSKPPPCWRSCRADCPAAQNIRLDADTIIALVIVWFLLSDDGGEVDWEQLILIGVLLVLGI